MTRSTNSLSPVDRSSIARPEHRRASTLALALLLGGSVVACEPVDGEALSDKAVDVDVQVKQQPILGGASTSVPWVGQLFDGTDPGYGVGCTGSLINERVVLTASHCVRGWTGMADRYEFQLEGTTERIRGRSIVNYGPDAGRHLYHTALADFFRANLTTTADRRGNNDVALVVLERPIFLERYASLSTSFPASGQTATTAGYGCNENRTSTGGGFLRYKSWAYSGAQSYEKSSALCSGDSGGPAWIGGVDDATKSVWAVNSSGGGTFDDYGNVVTLWPQIRSTGEAVRQQLAPESFPVLTNNSQGGRQLSAGEFWKGAERQFVLSGQETLVVSLANVAGDPDLYVKRDGQVDTGSYDCRPYFGAGQPESCVFFQPGSYSIGVRGYSATSFDLRAYVIKTGMNQISAGQWVRFPDGITVGAALSDSLRVSTGGRGDIDIYVRRGKPPTATEFDCRSNMPDLRDSCVTSGPGTYFVGALGKAPTSTASFFVEQRL